MFKILPIQGGVCAPQGFYADGIRCGLKENALDLCFIKSSSAADVAAVFTTNRFQAAPLIHAKQHLHKRSEGILTNSKNANAMTGQQGIKDIEEILKTLPFENPLMSSTGVIGVHLPKEKIINGIKRFDFTVRNGDNAARAIMTTDRWDKQISLQVITEEGESFRIGAMAKGAGMIAPNLATMLCFITTDAKVEREQLQKILESTVDGSFNAVSVDGDMSTNDSVFIFANGESNVFDEDAFTEALKMVMHHLALELVKDGEGATKLVGFEIKGAKNDEEAKTAAKAMRDSLLVKTALFGEDPNWGRLAMAIGASGVTCSAETLVINIGNVTLYERGRNLMNQDVEEKAAAVMQKEEFRVSCDLGIGDGCYTAYGCDLGNEYVKINADYRT